MKKIKLSVVLATKNEEANVSLCLMSIKTIADEIIIFDEHSTDKTVTIAESIGAKVYDYDRKTNFHETKQKAIEEAKGDWILQLDADEVVTPELAKEIVGVIKSSNEEMLTRVLSPSTFHHPLSTKIKLFTRHQHLIEQRDGKLGIQNGNVVAFFIPRVNMFLGKPLIHAGVYPDGVIRLIKRGKARLPAKSVHEQMEIDGEVGWLFNNLEHYDSPTLFRYFHRMNRYTDLQADDLKNKKVPKNVLYFILYTLYKPLYTFSNLFFRHKGFMDGIRGFLWSFFSALHFPLAYYKYWFTLKK